MEGRGEGSYVFPANWEEALELAAVHSAEEWDVQTHQHFPSSRDLPPCCPSLSLPCEN